MNFSVKAEEGYTIKGLSVKGNFNKLKSPDDLGTENIYSLTKVTGECEITVAAEALESSTDTGSDTSSDTGSDTNTDTDTNTDIETDTDDKPKRMYGDVDGDGKISAKDSMLVQRYAVKLKQLEGIDLIAAEVNADGKVTAKDALEILRYTIHMSKNERIGTYIA